VPLVVDASIVLAPGLGKTHPKIGPVLARMEDEEWIVPALWWFEVRNGRIVNERRGRVTEQETTQFLREISHSVSIDRSPDEAAVMALARRHRLTVYDATYLELALRERLPLATLDTTLAEAARREGVPVLE
jgi:predicted nucleic acid-binding protein